MNRFLLLFFTVAIIFFLPSSFSEEPPLFLLGESKYFSVYAFRDIDISALLYKLNFNYFVHFNELAETKDSQDTSTVLSNTLDALYLEVSDILDIHIYSFHGNIKIVPDRVSLRRVFNDFFKLDFTESSFYLYEKNTIYISFEDLTLGMLGHEVSHAVISHYFVVPPPVKIQEVLSGYVEYSLRKSTGTLQ